MSQGYPPPAPQKRRLSTGAIVTIVAAIVVILTLVGAVIAGVYLAGIQQASNNTNALAPTVTRASPFDGATGVPINTVVLITFSKAMDLRTISTSTIILRHGITSDPGAVSYTGFTATFIPSANLTDFTVYTAIVTTGAKDTLGNALAFNLFWSFETGTATRDVTPPYVIATSPIIGATGTPINTKILVTFSRAMDPATITTSTITLKHGTTADSGAVSYTGLTGTFTPLANLNTNTVYTATVTRGARDTSGRAIAVDFVWSFTTCACSDTTAPVVIGTSPVRGVPVDSSIAATFSKAMDPATITASTFTVKQGTTSVSGTVTYAGTTASFKPSSNLAANTTYTATITSSARDLAGNPMKSNFVWSFTTATIDSCSQATVELRSAVNFAVLGSSGVANTGLTSVTGDLGVSPGTSLTGFPPGTVTGTIHITDVVAAQAWADARDAYNDAVGRTQCVITVSGNLGGQTLAPGLYWSGSSLEISSGDLTLDAQGNLNAVFIFQVSSTLTITSGRQIILAGGAQAKNIFWVVGSSASLGTTSVFQGTIMAYASITLLTGSTLNGRALTQIGQVTMDSSTITKP